MPAWLPDENPATPAESASSPPEPRPHRVIQPWLIIAIGVVATGAALIWSSGLRDDTGAELLDEPLARVLVALLGASGTLLGLVLQRTAEVRHQVKNSHTTNMRDDMDAQAQAIADVRQIAEHAVRAARKASHDTVQLREDVQALRTDHTGTAADIRGIRRDIGRLTDSLTNPKGPTS